MKSNQKFRIQKQILDWMNKKSRSSIEMEDKSFRPVIIKDNLDVSKYDHIYLGFPKLV